MSYLFNRRKKRITLLCSILVKFSDGRKRERKREFISDRFIQLSKFTALTKVTFIENLFMILSVSLHLEAFACLIMAIFCNSLCV